jgi:DNA-binding PadR family transcriptional regulator
VKQPHRKHAAALTELEGCVLGLIATRGPCTPYAVRRELQESPSRHWSASAGAVYPLVRRLQRRGLVRVHGRMADDRRGRLYALTSAGQRAFRAWLGPPCLPAAVSVPPDPLRSRVAFLSVLERHAQAALLADALARMAAHLREVGTYTERKQAEGDRFEYLVSRGAYLMMQARIAWLEESARALGRGEGTTDK